MTDEMRDPGPIRDAIDKKVQELFDYNQRVSTVLRTQAKDFEVLATFFEQQKQRCYDIAALTVELALVAAENTGDILVAEFGVRLADDDGEGEADDEDL